MRKTASPCAMPSSASPAAQPPEAVRVSKALIRGRDRGAIAEVMRAEFEQFIARLFSPEAAEAFEAFAEKRAPDFSRCQQRNL